MSERRLWIQVGALFVVLYVALLGVRPMITPDEPRYGAMAADMLASGEWFKLRLAGFTYYEKPPMGIWLIALSEAVFGHNAFAVRLPGALASLVSALAAGVVARRMTTRREAAPLAALVQLTTAFPFVLGTVAVLDPIFSGFTSLTLAWFLLGAESRGRRRVAWLLASGAAAGLAFLTKGLLGFAIPALAAGGWLAWERRWRDLFTLPWLPMLGAALAAGPLAWMLHRSEPGFWNYFVVVEHFRRFANPDMNQHAEPWWLLTVVLVGGSLFWLLFWPRAARTLHGEAALRPMVRFCLAWVLPPLALLSLSSGKLPTYVLPLFPPIAALVATGLLLWCERVPRTWDRGTFVAIILLLALSAVAFLLAQFGLERFGLPRPWTSHETAHWALLGVALIAWAMLEGWAHGARAASAWLARMAWVPVPGLLCVHLLLPDALLSAPKTPWPLLARHEAALRGAARVATVNSMGHAVNWVTGRTDLVIIDDASEFDNELGLESERARFVANADLAATVRAWLREGPVTLVMATGSAKELADTLRPLVRASETDRDITVIELAP